MMMQVKTSQRDNLCLNLKNSHHQVLTRKVVHSNSNNNNNNSNKSNNKIKKNLNKVKKRRIQIYNKKIDQYKTSNLHRTR